MSENKNQQNGLITKWGNEVFDDGVMNAPECITKYGYRFMSGGEFSFVICLMSFKYDSRNPYPSQETVAKHMGVHVTQIERWVSSLFNKKGLININDRSLPDGTRTSNEYDFSPLLEKCLEESRKEKAKTAPKVKSKARERKKDNKEKSQEKISHTICMGHKRYPIQNVRVVRNKMYGWINTKCMGGSTQNVWVKKERFKKESFKKEIVNKVCVEEQQILDLIQNREDLNTHTQAIINLFKNLSKRSNYKHDVFLQTLDIINLDIYDMSYLKTALNNNMKKGHVKPFADVVDQPKKQTKSKKPIRTENLPDWFDKGDFDKEVDGKSLDELKALREVYSGEVKVWLEEKIKNIHESERKKKEIDDMLQKLRA